MDNCNFDRQKSRNRNNETIPDDGSDSGISIIIAQPLSSSSTSSIAAAAAENGNGDFRIRFSKIENRFRRDRALDVRPLTGPERLRLYGVHYVTMPYALYFASIVFCVFWCTLTSVMIIAEYGGYSTIAYLVFETPVSSRPPSITVCTHCVLCAFNDSSLQAISAKSIFDTDHILSLLHPEQNVSFSLESETINYSEIDAEITCKIVLDSMRNDDNDDDDNVKKKEEKNENEQNRKNESSSMRNDAMIPCAEFVPIVRSIQEGRKCYTYFSDLRGQMTAIIDRIETKNNPDNNNNNNNRELPSISPILRFDYSPGIEVSVSGRFVRAINFAQYAQTGSDVAAQPPVTGISVSIHDTSVLPDMYEMSFHALTAGETFTMPFEKRIQRLLPAPYKTGCFAYDHNRRRDDGDDNEIRPLWTPLKITLNELKYYRSRGECMLYCMWRRMNHHRNCINFYSIFDLRLLREAEAEPNNDNNNNNNNNNGFKYFCPKSDSDYHEYMATKESCLRDCAPDCVVETYVENGAVNRVEISNKSLALVDIIWAEKPVTEIRHQTKWDASELLGTLGGQAHIWLGVSVLHFLLRTVSVARRLWRRLTIMSYIIV